MVARSNSDNTLYKTLEYDSASRLLDALIQDDVDGLNDFPDLEGYVLNHRLGEGGGGVVYHGVREGSDRPVAVKVFNQSAESFSRPSRIWRELDMLAQLRLPSTPRLHDYGISSSDGRMFIVNEHIEGLTLAEYCDTNALSRRDRVALLIKVALAVQSLHERGVIHRDIKPENILIDINGEPVIIDLGLAVLIDESVADHTNQEDELLGSPPFMAPEQARREQNSISTRTDIYSLGATAYYLLIRETPHEMTGSLDDVLKRIVNKQPRDPRQLDQTIDHTLSLVLKRAVEPDPEDRYACASDMAEALRKWVDGEPISWTNPPITQRAGFWIRRNPLMFILLLILGAGLLVGTYAVVSYQQTVLQQRQEVIEHQQTVMQQRQEVIRQQEKILQQREAFHEWLDYMTDTFIPDMQGEPHVPGTLGDHLAQLLLLDEIYDELYQISDGWVKKPIEVAREQAAYRIDRLSLALQRAYRMDELGGRQQLAEIENLLWELEDQRLPEQP